MFKQLVMVSMLLLTGHGFINAQGVSIGIGP